MDARETTKQVTLEVDGKSMVFEIDKMDALHGAGLMKFAAQKILPILGMAENAADSLKEKARNLADQEPDKAETTEKEAEELKKPGIGKVFKTVDELREDLLSPTTTENASQPPAKAVYFTDEA